MNTRVRSILAAVVSAFVAYFLVGALLPNDDGPARGAVAEARAEEASGSPHADLVEVPRERAEQLAGASAPAAARAPVVADEGPRPPPTASGALVLGVVLDRVTRAPYVAGIELVTDDRSFGRVISDDSGRFAFGPLEPGSYELLVRPDDGLPTVARVEVVGTNDVRTEVLVDRSQFVKVRLVDGTGAPLLPRLSEVLDARLRFTLQIVPVATREHPGDVFDGVRGSLNNPFGIGSYRQAGGRLGPVDGDALGTVELSERSPAWISLVVAHQVLATQQIFPETTEVVFTLEPQDFGAIQASVRAVVVDAVTKEPLVADFWFSDDPFPNGSKSGTTNAAGELDASAVAPGKRWLVVQASGKAPLVRSIVIPRGAELDLGVLELHAPIEIRGSVRDSNGTPHALDLRWGRVDALTGAIDWVRQTSATSDADGSFALGRLEPDVWAVGLVSPRVDPNRPEPVYFASPIVIVDARNGSVSDVALAAAPATLVTCRPSKRFDVTAYVRVYDEAGRSAASSWLQALAPQGVTALLPGTYQFAVVLGDTELARTTAVVGDAPMVVAIDVP